MKFIQYVQQLMDFPAEVVQEEAGKVLLNRAREDIKTQIELSEMAWVLAAALKDIPDDGVTVLPGGGRIIKRVLEDTINTKDFAG